jgi:hypothetical protein
MAEDQPERVEIRAVWVGVEDLPIVFVNQSIGQVDDRGDIILTFGQATPPIILGTPEQQRQQLQDVPFIQVRPVSRLTLSRPRAEEVVRMLQQTLENQQRMVAALQAQEGDR